MSKMVNIKINGMSLTVPEGTTILEAARSANINIPTLCFLKDINEIGACRICLVEVKGAKAPVASCVYPVFEGMECFTNTPKILNSRRTTLELILSTHECKCLSCVRGGDCELQRLCKDYGVEDAARFEGTNPYYEHDNTTAYISRNNNKCVLCRRCVAECEHQGIGVIGTNDRGFDTHVGCSFDRDLGSVACIGCGQCVAVCPTGALVEQDNTNRVWEALADPEKFVVVNTAPAVRVTLGECFDMPIGTNVRGKMAAALRRLGFDKVFDTDFAADLTIMEEANEFLDRVKNGGKLPMITSCSPGWIKYCEHYFPNFIPNLSTCKSPQQMFGAITKTYYAEKMGLDPKNIFVVSVMPCIAKKFEITRDHQAASGYPDTDVSITTRELSRMIKRAGLRFEELPDDEFDNPLGMSTGAASIFGTSGGVMEAALRTAAEWLENKPLEDVEFTAVRGMDNIKEAVYHIAGMDVKVAVASGTKNAKELLRRVEKGEADYHFIEVMGCPGGCINGGGQPYQPASVRNFVDVKGLRSKALYADDENMVIRKSHENPAIKELYAEYLGEPGSHKAHEILHTEYTARPKY